MSSLVVGVAGLAAFLGALVSIRRYLVRPILAAVQEFRALLELPEMVRDLTSTTTRYVAENERRLQLAETRITRVERAVLFLLRRIAGVGSLDDLENGEPT